MIKPKITIIGQIALLTLSLFVENSWASTYYVATNGSDGNPGTLTQPWRTIVKAAETMIAGDTVLVRAGTYSDLSPESDRAMIVPAHSGAPGNLITFKAFPGETVIIDGKNGRQFSFELNGRDYIRIEGFEIVNVTGHGILVSWESTSGYGVEIVRNTIHNCGDNPDTAGIYYRFSRQGLIQDNVTYNNAGDGITFDVTDGITIRGNLIYNNAVDGIKGGGEGTIIIESNIIHDMTSGTNHGDCMQLMGNTGTLIVRNNITWDCTQNIYLDDYSPTAGTTPWGDVYIYNNVVFNDQWVSVSSPGYYNGIVTGPRYNNWRSLTIYHNTLVNLNDGNGGIAVANPGDQGPYRINTVRVFNNLFYNSINNVQPSAANTLYEDYNLYFNQWRDWYLPGWINLSQFQAENPGLEQHSRYADVSFVRNAYPNPDFHLKPGSSAIDNGIPLTSVNGISFNFDRDNVARPQGLAWDIGAYEYVGGGTPSPDTTPPAAPTKVRVK